MNCATLAEIIGQSPTAGLKCRQDGDLLRLETPFRYPDGGTMELFVEEHKGLRVVTDLGEGFRFLEKGGIEPMRSPSRQRVIELSVRLAGARLDNGVVEIPVTADSEFLGAVMRLAQAITRIADLSLLVKGSFSSTFSDAVEEYLRASTHGVEIQRGAMVQGNATRHHVDILARSNKGVSVVESLSALTPAGANAQTAFTIQKFADISAIGTGAPERFAILDESAEVWSASLRKQLSRFADVLDWEHRDTLKAAL